MPSSSPSSRRSATVSDEAVAALAVGLCQSGPYRNGEGACSDCRETAAEALPLVYPIIRADVIAEVVGALQAQARRAGTSAIIEEITDFIEREVGK